MYLQPKLSQRLSQRQVLTPGLVQMVSVLALNKLELKEMLNSEMVENPVLEELEESALSLDERSGIEGERERSAEDLAAESRLEKDPFDEIDFGSYFQDYLDPGFRTASNFEESDKPSFEHFLSQPSRLSDHLEWQLGSLTLSGPVRAATELIVGNLNENGYLIATDEELAEALLQVLREAGRNEPLSFDRGARIGERARPAEGWVEQLTQKKKGEALHSKTLQLAAAKALSEGQDGSALALAVIEEARGILHQLDPLGIGARDLRECLLIQIRAQRREAKLVLGRREALSIAFLKPLRRLNRTTRSRPIMAQRWTQQWQLLRSIPTRLRSRRRSSRTGWHLCRRRICGRSRGVAGGARRRCRRPWTLSAPSILGPDNGITRARRG